VRRLHEGADLDDLEAGVRGGDPERAIAHGKGVCPRGWKAMS